MTTHEELELVESFLNGNRSYIVDKLSHLKTSEVLRFIARLFEENTESEANPAGTCLKFSLWLEK